MKKIFLFLAIIAFNSVCLEQEPYPMHIAKGSNTKCFMVGDENLTLPQHLLKAKDLDTTYDNVFLFHRWNNKTVEQFNTISSLTKEDLQRIIEERYRIQKIKLNKFAIYLTAQDQNVKAYFDNELLTLLKKTQIND